MEICHMVESRTMYVCQARPFWLDITCFGAQAQKPFPHAGKKTATPKVKQGDCSVICDLAEIICESPLIMCFRDASFSATIYAAST